MMCHKKLNEVWLRKFICPFDADDVIGPSNFSLAILFFVWKKRISYANTFLEAFKGFDI